MTALKSRYFAPASPGRQRRLSADGAGNSPSRTRTYDHSINRSLITAVYSEGSDKRSGSDSTKGRSTPGLEGLPVPGALDRRYRLSRKIALVLVGLVGLTSCSDILAPAPADALLPAVVDAQTRLARGIVDVPLRQHAVVTLSSLRLALIVADGTKAQFEAGQLAAILSGHHVADGADISAILLVVAAVQDRVPE